MIIQTKGEKIFQKINGAILIQFAIATLYPLWYVLIASISEASMVSSGKVTVIPLGFELAAYWKVFNLENIWTSYGNTVFYAIVGTMTSMILTILGGYALSKKRLKGRRIFTLIIMLTMWFNPGMMPHYLNLKNLNLLDTRLAVIIYLFVSAFYLVLMRTFFESVPASMEESGKMDGASDVKILAGIYLPLSVPALATLTLYYFIDRWNSYFWAMIIIKDQSKIPLQVLLKKLIVEMSNNFDDRLTMDMTVMSRETVIYATIIVAVLPMLLIYPFVQKYFVKGIMVGAIKG